VALAIAARENLNALAGGDTWASARIELKKMEAAIQRMRGRILGEETKDILPSSQVTRLFNSLLQNNVTLVNGFKI
jgi:hypothetical protein